VGFQNTLKKVENIRGDWETHNTPYRNELYNSTVCKRKKDKNNEVYYKVRFPRQTFFIYNNRFYEKIVKGFKVVKNIKEEDLTIEYPRDENKTFKAKYRTVGSIPKYIMYKLVGRKQTSLYKVSNIFLRKDVNDNPYYWIQKTIIQPFRSDDRHKITRHYYIFLDGINKNLTIKNNAKMWCGPRWWRI